MVIGAILICFALLFPTVFQPMLNSLFGRGSTSNQSTQKNARPPIGGRSAVPSSRGGPPLHPAAAAQMRMPFESNTNPQSGSRVGMISWMMPIYTVGVVAFLGYTLYKVCIF